MKKIIVLLVSLVSSFSSSINADNTYDPATKVLTLGSLAVTGDQTYKNVVVRLDQFSVLGAGNTFDPETKVLTIDSLAVTGDQTYKNVVVRLDRFSVLGVGNAAPSGNGVSAVCGPEHITFNNYNAIQMGMTLDQVKQIIGCEPDQTFQQNDFVVYGWFWYLGVNKSAPIAAITVDFDYPGLTATDRLGPAFKQFVAD